MDVFATFPERFVAFSRIWRFVCARKALGMLRFALETLKTPRCRLRVSALPARPPGKVEKTSTNGAERGSGTRRGVSCDSDSLSDLHASLVEVPPPIPTVVWKESGIHAVAQPDGHAQCGAALRRLLRDSSMRGQGSFRPSEC